MNRKSITLLWTGCVLMATLPACKEKVAQGEMVTVSWNPCTSRTRTSYEGIDTDQEADLREVYIAAYMEDGGQLIDEAYGINGEVLELTLPAGYVYRFLTLVNCGHPEMPDNLQQARLERIILPPRGGTSGLDPFPEGLPMAGSTVKEISFSGDLGELSVRRLVSRWKLSIANPDKLHFSVRSIQMHSCSYDITPWKESSFALNVGDGDRASASDLERINSNISQVYGPQITLYVAENMRGEVPFCSTEALRDAKKMGEAGIDVSRFTYCEIQLDFDPLIGEYMSVNSDASIADVTLRYYLGSGPSALTTDFNIPRGSEYPLLITLTRAGIDAACSNGGSWRLTADVVRR